MEFLFVMSVDLLFDGWIYKKYQYTNSWIVIYPFRFAHRKDQKKVDKLLAQIPYHEGRGNKDEVEKIKEQVESIWQKTRDEFNAKLM